MSEASELVGLVPRFEWTRAPYVRPVEPLRPVAPARSSRGRGPSGFALLLALGCVAWLATSSQVPAAPAPPPPAVAAVAPCGPTWVTAWQARPAPSGATLRMVVHPEATGSQVRVRLSNRFGTTPLVVGTATAGRSDGAAGVLGGTTRQVAFDGRPGVTIPPGAEVLSDPAPVQVDAGLPLAVSLHLVKVPDVVTRHQVALQTSYLAAPGNLARTPGGTAFTTPVSSWFVLTGVDVLAARPTHALVAVGDSITDGVGSPIDAEERWSDALAGRLSAAGETAGMAVLNAGLSGNQLLPPDPANDVDSPRARFATDVVDAEGATDIVLNIGTNDLAAGRSAADVITGLQRYAQLAHVAGKRIFLTTITPSTLGPHGTPAAVAARDEVNAWIRARGREIADGVFDFAAAVADPAQPQRLAPLYDAGDGLHLSAAGYRALADAVDLTQLTGSPCLTEPAPERTAVAAG